MALTRLPGFTIDSTSSFTFANASVTANVTAGNIKTDNLLYANGVAWSFGSGTTYSNANVANYLPTYTGEFTVANITSSGNITATYLIGNGSQLTGLPASYANANVEAFLPTYTGNLSAGNLITTGSSGNISGANYVISNYFQGNGSLLTFITGANVNGTVSSATTAATVTTNAQPNITSVGTLSSVTVTGLITATAGGIKVGNLQDTSGTNTVQLTNSDILVTGNISAGAGGTGNVTATYFIGNGSSLTHIAGGNVDGTVSSATTAGTVTTAAQPNITSVGNLVNANIDGNVLVTGNLIVGGNTNYINVDTLVIEDPIIEMGGGANGATLTTNDGKDRGSLLHYYTTAPVDAFMGWDNSNGEFAFGSNVSVSSEVVTFNTFGNVRANTFIGALSGAATTAATVTTNAQPNITSVGTLSSLTVSNNATVGTAAYGALALDGTNGITTTFSIAEHSASWTISFWMYIPTQTINFPFSLFYTPGSNFSFVYGWNGGSNWRLGLTANGMTYCDVDFASALTQNTWYFVSVSYNSATSTVNIGLDGVVTSFSGRTVSSGGYAGLTFGENTLTNGFANTFGPIYLADVSVITGTANYTSNFTKPTTHPAVASGQRLLLLTKTSGTFLYDEVSAANVSYVTASPTYYSGNPIGASGDIISYANITASYFIGNGSQLTSIAGANVLGTVANATYSTTTGIVTTAAQPNITSVGTLTTVSVTGNVSSGGNIIGNGQYLTSITGANVSGEVTFAATANSVAGGNVTGQVGNALVAGTVYTNAQPNITSVGTLTTLSVTGNITAGNINGGNAIVGNYFVGDGSLLTGLPASYANANVENYLPTYTGNFSPSNLVVSTSANLGAVGNITITGGSANYVLTTDGAGSLSWAAQSGGGATSTTISVDNFTGDGSNDTFTLSVTPTSVNSVFVNYNGAFVGRGSYELDGADLTFGSIPADGASIEVTTIEGLTIGSGAFTTRTATGDGSTVNYTVTSGATVSSVLATLDGVLQTPTTDYTISGSTLTFTTAPATDVAIQIRELAVASSSGGGGASNISIRAQAMTMGIIFGG